MADLPPPPPMHSAAVDPWDLVRVDVPDWPGAETSSAHGSLLLEAPPPGTPWRHEAIPEVDGETGPVVASEAIDALAAGPWHEAGIVGEGVKLAVFDVQWYGAELREEEYGAFETHDCFAHRSCEPAMDTLRARYSWEEGSHGAACAEIARDMAPGADLHLVRVNAYTTLENAVEWAIREEVDVASMSMSFYNHSAYDGTGEVSDLVDRLAEAGVLLVTSAGNGAEEHWAGDFTDEDGDGRHEFPWGSEYLPMELPQGGSSVYITWNEFDACGRSDLDAYVYDADGNLRGRSTDAQDPDADRCEPVERVAVSEPTDGWSWLLIHRVRGGFPLRIDVVARNGSVWNAVPEGSLADPASHPNAFAVGAVLADLDYATSGPVAYSSRGPTAAGFEKPDIAGPTGLSTSGVAPHGFHGTSASAPAVAGAVALLLSEDPARTPEEAAGILRDTALRERAAWEEAGDGLGAGRARLPPPGAIGSTRGCGGALLAPALFVLLPGRRFSAIRFASRLRASEGRHR